MPSLWKECFQSLIKSSFYSESISYFCFNTNYFYLKCSIIFLPQCLVSKIRSSWQKTIISFLASIKPLLYISVKEYSPLFSYGKTSTPLCRQVFFKCSTKLSSIFLVEKTILILILFLLFFYD